MAIEGFDYQSFSQALTEQAKDLLPDYFNEFQINYVVNTLKNFSNLAGEALYNDETTNFNAEQAMLITQIIAEWSFHKSIDLIKSGILPDHWDGVMQKIAFTIFEIAKQTVLQNLPQDQILQIVEHHVHQAYDGALNELKERKVIDEEVFDKAAHQSNIDEMMAQIQKDKDTQAAVGGQTDGPSSNDSKILKLASVALLLRQVSQDKVHTILNKFNPEDAQAVIQYMQMQDLEDKVDRDIAMRCLQEIKTNLPEPKTMSPQKILEKIKKALNNKDRVKVEASIRNERPNIKKFISNAYEGEVFPMPSKVASIITQHIEENV